MGRMLAGNVVLKFYFVKDKEGEKICRRLRSTPGGALRRQEYILSHAVPYPHQGTGLNVLVYYFARLV